MSLQTTLNGHQHNDDEPSLYVSNPVTTDAGQVIKHGSLTKLTPDTANQHN